MNQFLSNPFFWALVSMFSFVGACSVVGSRKIGSYPAAGWVIVTILSLGRVILVLPSVDQPRFFINGFNAAIGIPIFIIGLCFALGPCFLIRPLNIAEEDMEFISNSFYKHTRNPIYLGEILWCLGWSIIHGSIIGVALVPVWWSGFLFLILIEEESLQRAIGTKYVDYKKKVRGRIVPGLPYSLFNPALSVGCAKDRAPLKRSVRNPDSWMRDFEQKGLAPS